MKPLLIISLIECCYLIFIIYFFKTTIDFNILASPQNFMFKHLVGNQYGNRICLFGKIIIIPVIVLLIIRNYINIPKYIIQTILVIGFLLTLINLNALVYLVPVFITEIYLLVYN